MLSVQLVSPDGKNNSVLCICIYIHVYLYVHIKCMSVTQSYLLLEKQISAYMLELNRPIGVLAPDQVWEPLP